MQQVPPPPPSSSEPAYRRQAGGNPWAPASLLLALLPVAVFIVPGFVGPSLGTVEVALLAFETGIFAPQ